MLRTSHEQRSNSSKEDEARDATQQSSDEHALPPLAATNLFVSPFGVLSAFLGDMDRMVRGFGLTSFAFPSGSLSPNQAEPSAPPTWAPPLEVLMRDGQFVVRAEIPGIDKDHVTVEIDEGRAVISGERQEEQEDKRGRSYRSERSYGRFSLVVPLPDGANAEQAKAMSADGILEIVIPMSTPDSKAHRLEIHERGTPAHGNGEKGNQRSRARKRPEPRAGRQRKRGSSARHAH